MSHLSTVGANIHQAPIPLNEMQRLQSLSDLDVDYINIGNSLNDLTVLASKIAGTSISLINLIDSYTQWTVARHGIDIEQMPREDSVCQYTIMGPANLEINNLADDERFKDKGYVVNAPMLRYYYGVPLNDGKHNIGALCVLDTNPKVLEPEKAELLSIIADEIVSRLKSQQVIETLKARLEEMTATQNKLVHDIRGPIGGMVGLAQLYKTQTDSITGEEINEIFSLIENGGKSILSLADDILSNTKKPVKNTGSGAKHSQQYNLTLLKEAIEKLYLPMAKNKGIHFTVCADTNYEDASFPKNKLVQIIGNLISNAIKFTPIGGEVKVLLNFIIKDEIRYLHITVKDTGIGISSEAAAEILTGSATTTHGTSGEKGYGFGLSLVKQLIEGLSGTLHIQSVLNEGACFEVSIPQLNERSITKPMPVQLESFA